VLFEKQTYQQDCINNINQAVSDIDFKNADYSCLADNLKTIACDNNYHQFEINKKPRLDVLMETGTGKTFVYLQTIFELNKNHKQNKFIIVLPRVAIKLGVVQQIELTKQYFYNLYKKHINIIDYPKDNLQRIQQDFIKSDNLQVLIMTNSAFNSIKTNNINKRFEGLIAHKSTWGGIASKNPIVIIDEPHLLKASKTTEKLEQLKNSLFIRFGATYPADENHKLSNVVYMLDSISAFNQYLVKRIGVSTIFAPQETDNIKIGNIQPKVKFKVHYQINNQLYQQEIFINNDIGAITGLKNYQGISVVKINKNKIFLSNGETLQPDLKYDLSDGEITCMITETINLHFKKEQKLFKQNIKALSLFFIPNIADFRGDNARIKNIFTKEYKKIRQRVYRKSTDKKYKKYLDQDYKDGVLQVAEGYFSGDKGTAEKKIADGIDLILSKKEKLLSFATPLRFIFSIWALQEGWDNPNIFTICKIATSNRDTSRRQQVGRGLRIATNQQGRRLTFDFNDENPHKFYDINTLDMVVSGQEKDFIHNIQNEILTSSYSITGDTINNDILKNNGLRDREASHLLDILEDNNIISYDEIADDYTLNSPILEFLNNHQDKISSSRITADRFDFIKNLFKQNHINAITDNNKKSKKQVKIRPDKFKSFKNLWESLNKKSKIVYQNIQQQQLIRDITNNFNQEPIQPQKIIIIQQKYNSQTNEIEDTKERSGNKINFFQQQNKSEYITKFAEEQKLPLHFVISLFNDIDNNKFNHNPQLAKSVLIETIKNKIHQSMITSVGYKFNQTSIYANDLQDENGKLKNNIQYTLLGHFIDEDSKPKDEFLYDSVVYDSNIEKQSIISDTTKINNDTITVFAKLPKINIPTPYKTYNPDFAYLIEKSSGKQLFLIVETKGYEKHSDIPEQEQQKIEYAKIFFKNLQKELPAIQIKYQTRITGQKLTDILGEQ